MALDEPDGEKLLNADFVYSCGMRVLAFIIIILICYVWLCMCVCERKDACPMVISVCYCVASIFV